MVFSACEAAFVVAFLRSDLRVPVAEPVPVLASVPVVASETAGEPALRLRGAIFVRGSFGVNEGEVARNGTVESAFWK